MEKVRATTALAAQEARESRAAATIASKHLAKFVKLQFNINSTLCNKYVKKLDADAPQKKLCTAFKPVVQAMVKLTSKCQALQAARQCRMI